MSLIYTFKFYQMYLVEQNYNWLFVVLNKQLNDNCDQLEQ